MSEKNPKQTLQHFIKWFQLYLILISKLLKWSVWSHKHILEYNFSFTVL